MAVISASTGSFSVKAYAGDNKTLLAFNFADAASAKNLAGFTIQSTPPGQKPYYLLNTLRFEKPGDHAQEGTESPNASVNAPLQKFRWTHVPGTAHQGLQPALGNYTYTVTPRFFDGQGHMIALDASRSASVTIPVGPFRKGSLALGFTRGYMQSEAFTHHFGDKTPIQPAGKPLQFKTSAQAGTNNGQSFSFADVYSWMGSTARQQVFAVLNKVLNDTTLHLDVFAYDLNEPDVLAIFLQLAAQGRIRIILDSSKEHHTADGSKAEDQFAALFSKQAKSPAAIERGAFGRFSHDKIFIVSKNGAAQQVLTGSTNFSITGLYVNANHVLVFNDSTVANQYAQVFQESWKVLNGHSGVSTATAKAFATNPLAMKPFAIESTTVPKMSITYSPHTASVTNVLLNGIATRIHGEASKLHGNVLFAVMQLTGSETPSTRR
jgi:hypothetical protein